jgi:AcrR family transcriptional regulator
VRPRGGGAAAPEHRATAYRYFPSEEALVVEASLVREFRSASEVLPDDAPAGPASRAVTVQRYLFDHARAHEVEFRAFLRATFEQWLSARGEPEAPLRAGRRMEMFARALAPVEADIGADTARRLELALSMMSGVESLIAARDVCRIDPDEARDIMSWAVQTLVRAVLAGAPGDT